MPLLARSRTAGATIVVFAVLSAAMFTSTTRAEEVLTLEDVVRMHVSGRSTVAILETIRSSPVQFDLSEEMLEELRYAGLSDRLIEAMQDRQLELHPPAAAPAGEAAPAPLVLEFTRKTSAAKKKRPKNEEPDPPALPPLRLLNAPTLELVQRAGIEPSMLTDLAVWIGCTTPTHVPDHWRGESPLGRDFSGTPRHRMLAFVPGARLNVGAARETKMLRALLAEVDRSEAEVELGLLELTVPETVEIELDPAEEHTLVIGVAVGLGDRFIAIAADAIEAFVPEDRGGRLVAELRDGEPYTPAQIKVKVTVPDRP